MAIIPSVEETDANDDLAATYQKIKDRYGGHFLPEIYKVMGNDATYVDSLNDHMARVLEPRKVDARTKEVIAFTVAALTGCDFCAHAHTMGLRQHGYDDEAIAELLGTVALWNEVTRFNIGARIHWPYQTTNSSEEAA